MLAHLKTGVNQRKRERMTLSVLYLSNLVNCFAVPRVNVMGSETLLADATFIRGFSCDDYIASLYSPVMIILLSSCHSYIASFYSPVMIMKPFQFLLWLISDHWSHCIAMLSVSITCVDSLVVYQHCSLSKFLSTVSTLLLLEGKSLSVSEA